MFEAVCKRAFKVFYVIPKLDKTTSSLKRNSVGWWVNGAVAPIQQPSDGGLQTPSPAGTKHWPTSSPHPDLSLSIWPSLHYKSTPDPCSAFQHFSNWFHVYSFSSKRQSVTDEQLDSKTVRQLCFWIWGKMTACLFVFATILIWNGYSKCKTGQTFFFFLV